MLYLPDRVSHAVHTPPCTVQQIHACILQGVGCVLAIRLHSHWEAPGYFDAADEHGFFVSPGLPSNCNTPACTNLTMRTWKKMISTHRNNPSVMDACMGNEGYADWMPVNGHR